MNFNFREKWKRFAAILLYHRFAIVTMMVVAILYGMPGIIAREAIGPEYKGVPYLVSDSEGEYLGRIHEIFDGHPSVSSPVFYEYKDSVSLIPPTGEFIFYALPKLVTGLSMGTVILLNRFILPAIIFIFLYALIYSVSASSGAVGSRSRRISAIAGSLLITVGASVIDYRGFVSYLIHGSSSPALLWLTRLVNPVTGTLLLSVLLCIVWKIFVDKDAASLGRGRWTIIIAGVVILAAMSGYIFSFSIGLTICLLLVIYLLLRRNLRDAIELAVVPVGAVLLNGIYFLSAFLTVVKSAPTSDPLKSGMFLTHVPTVNIVSTLVLILVLFLFFVFYRREVYEQHKQETDLRWWWFALAVSLSCIIVYVQQIVTGVTVWPQHFSQYTVPLGMLVCVILLENVIQPRWKWVWLGGISVILFISITIGIRSLQSVEATIPQYADQQTFAPVFDWLNRNAPKDCVVYVSSDYAAEINRFVAGFTSCNVYHSFHIYNGVPEDRIMHNFLVNMRLRGIRLADVPAHIKENWFWFHAYFFRDWGDMFCCVDPWLKNIKNPQEIAVYFDSVEQDILKLYPLYLKTDLLTELKKYRLDYMIVDTEQQPQVNPKQFPFLIPRAQFGRFVIYSVK